MRRFGGADGEENARAFLEQLRWPGGPVCPRCGAKEPYKLVPRPTSKHPGRPGLYKCRAPASRPIPLPLGAWFVKWIIATVVDSLRIPQ